MHRAWRIVLLPLVLLLPLGVLLAVPGCSNNGRDSGAPGMSEEHATVEARLPLEIGGKRIRAQVALTPAEQARGLMYRESLGADEGMLFPFREGRRQSFWMKDVPIALDIAYIDGEGVLREVRRGLPQDRSPIPSRRGDIQFVLEMRAGWFAENEVRAGARLDLELVRKALRARGADTAQYGL